MSHRTKPLNMIAAAAALVLFAGSRIAGAVAPDLQEESNAGIEAVEAAAAELGEAARNRIEPLAEGEVKVLEAVVMEVSGRAQWRPGAEAAWQDAAVNDLLRSGAMIRTGRNSTMALRVGHNATVLVDRNTRLVLPEIVQDGQTLRTAVQVNRGRADFKVDRVGPVNDFSVVTPSTTLAVRSTAYGVEYGGFDGTSVVSARTNAMLAIEVRYFLTLYTYYISGGGSTTERTPNPVLTALFQSFGPPPLMAAIIEDEDAPELMAAGMQNPAREVRQVDLATESFRNTLSLGALNQLPAPPPVEPLVFDPNDFQFGSFTRFRDVGQFLCDRLVPIFRRFEVELTDARLSTRGINTLRGDIAAICNDGSITDEDFVTMFGAIVSYCEHRNRGDRRNISRCVEAFVSSFNLTAERPPTVR